jgi:hypothetical protein
MITNCHVHTFTHAHTPDRFLRWPVNALVRFWLVRQLLFWLARTFDRERKTRLGRYAEIIKTSYARTQADVFRLLQDSYPVGTRFVVLPMDMSTMNAGSVQASIEEQHAELAALRDSHPESVLPFAAVDPRHPGIVEKTIALLENAHFRGIKLYPPTGYHPFDSRLHELYARMRTRTRSRSSRTARHRQACSIGATPPRTCWSTQSTEMHRSIAGATSCFATSPARTRTCRFCARTPRCACAWPISAARVSGGTSSSIPGLRAPLQELQTGWRTSSS